MFFRNRFADGGEAGARERVFQQDGAARGDLPLRTPVECGTVFRKSAVTPARAVEAKPPALERGEAELGGITAFRALADACHSLRIFRCIARDHVQRQCRVAHIAGDRPHHVARGSGQRHHARIGHQPKTGLEADQGLRGGRILDGATGFLRQAQHGHAGPHRSGGARRAAVWHIGGCCGIQRGSRPAIAGMGAGGGEDGHVGLTQDDTTRRLHARHHGRVGLRDKIHATRFGGQEMPARRGGQARHIHRVLHHHRNACQRPQFLACGPAAVDLTRILQRAGIHDDDGIVARVVSGNALEERLSQFL